MAFRKNQLQVGDIVELNDGEKVIITRLKAWWLTGGSIDTRAKYNGKSSSGSGLSTITSIFDIKKIITPRQKVKNWYEWL